MGDAPHHTMPNDDETEHHGGGQSGYGAGRLGGDRTMGPAFGNQESGNHSHDDRQAVRTDERFTGRGGEPLSLDRDSSETGTPFRGGGNAGAVIAGDDENQRYPDELGPGEQDEQRGNAGQPGYTRSDDRIKESVGEALEADHIDAAHIEVLVKNGEVFLTGLVEDPRQNRLAEDLIGRLPGVKAVQNQLRLRGNQNTDSAVGQVETVTSPTDNKLA